MSAKTETKIQWCDFTVNPVMGCDGCPLSPPPGKVALNLIQKLMGAIGTTKPENKKETEKNHNENSADEPKA